MDIESEFEVNGLKITSRNYIDSDYDFYYKLIKDSLHKYITKFYPWDIKIFDFELIDANRIKVLECKNERIGVISLKEEDEILIIESIFFIQSYQRQGIGKYFMNYFESFGFAVIGLYVWENNPAVEFYKKLDFKIVKNKDHRYYMEKNI